MNNIMVAAIIIFIVSCGGNTKECDYKIGDTCVNNHAFAYSDPSQKDVELALIYWSNIYSIEWMKNGTKALTKSVSQIDWIEGPPSYYANSERIVCGDTYLSLGLIEVRLDKQDVCNFWATLFHEMTHNMLRYNGLDYFIIDKDMELKKKIRKYGDEFRKMLEVNVYVQEDSIAIANR